MLRFIFLYIFLSQSLLFAAQEEADSSRFSAVMEEIKTSFETGYAYFGSFSSRLNDFSGLDAQPSEWLFILITAWLLAGVLLGMSGWIVVYEDISDLFLNFLLVSFPLLTLGIAWLSFSRITDLTALATLSLEALILILILAKSLRSNGWNPIKTLFAFPTKVVLGVSFLLVFLTYLNHRGGRNRQDLGWRRIFSIAMVLIAPFLVALIKQKEDPLLKTTLYRRF